MIFFIIFFTHVKMSKDTSAKYYQNNREILQEKLVKVIKIFLKKKNKKSNNMIVNNTKIYLKMKNKNWLSIEKHITK